MSDLAWLTPDWPAPANVRAAVTLRSGGVSQGPYASLNLALHVGDDPGAVLENRRRLREALRLPSEPVWLEQVHGTTVFDATVATETPPSSDAAVCREPGRVCVVMTADCLPVLFCSQDGQRIGVAHAGWRGLAGGVLAATIDALGGPHELLAWLGPAIEPEAFEVGEDVVSAFTSRHPDNERAFVRNSRGRFQADLYRLARMELQRLGVRAIHGGGLRCYADAERFFSHRRGAPTGRMATLIWREA
jgi:YfiH family protein